MFEGMSLLELKAKRAQLAAVVQQLLLWQAMKARGTVRRISSPAPHVKALCEALDTFIDLQRLHIAELAAANESSVDDAWRETWKDGHHHRDDLACPACGTDSTTGCIV